MCRRVGCSRCGKVTWSGCGAHVDSVMRGVPEAERCHCAERQAPPPKSGPDAKRRWWPFS
ncbi:MAG: hypothetical protein ACYCWW_20480 [Deltaproteobacteria bacterium]